MRPKMRQVLEQAQAGPLRRVLDDKEGASPWPAKWQTLRALERRGLLSVSRRLSRAGVPLDEWSITEAGRAALKGPELVGRERPVFPAKGGGSTSDWTRAVDHDPRMGALDDMGAPSEEWLRVSRVKRLAVQDRKVRARQAARNMAA